MTKLKKKERRRITVTGMVVTGSVDGKGVTIPVPIFTPTTVTEGDSIEFELKAETLLRYVPKGGL